MAQSMTDPRHFKEETQTTINHVTAKHNESRATRPLGYKAFFTLNSFEIPSAHKTKILTTKKLIALSLSDFVFIMLINVKMPKIVELSMEKVL